MIITKVCEFKTYAEFDEYFDQSPELVAFRSACCVHRDTADDSGMDGESEYDDCIDLL